MEQEFNNKILTFSELIRQELDSTVNKWESTLKVSPPAKRIKNLKTFSQEIDSLLEALKQSPLLESIKMGAYYRELLELTSSYAIGKEEVQEFTEIARWFKYALRQIVEMMNKEELFDGFSTEVDIFNQQFNGSTDLFASFFFDSTLDMLIEYARKPWLRNKISVGLYGRMCAGKTSVLNSLFNENFPVCLGENTAIPTYLYYGEELDFISLIDAHDNIQKIGTSDISIIDWEKSYHFPFHRLYDYIAKQNSSEILKSFTFVDAPGVLSGQSSNHIAADKSIENTDIIIWVSDINKSFEKDQIDYLLKHVNNKPIYIVLTFTNLMTDEQYSTAKQVYIDKIEEYKLNVKGIIRYNSNEPELFKETFHNHVIIGSIADEDITAFSPEEQLMTGLRYLRNILQANLEHYTSVNTNAISEQERLENKLSTQYNILSNRLNELVSAYNHMCYEYNDSILLSAMLEPINRMSNDIDRLIEAYNETNIADLAIDMTRCIYNSSEAKKKQEKIKDLQEKLEAIIDNIF